MIPFNDILRQFLLSAYIGIIRGTHCIKKCDLGVSRQHLSNGSVLKRSPRNQSPPKVQRVIGLSEAMNELRGAARNLVPMRKSQQPKKTVKTAVRSRKRWNILVSSQLLVNTFWVQRIYSYSSWGNSCNGRGEAIQIHTLENLHKANAKQVQLTRENSRCSH
jgi:hypothetical protein